jgi:hypothetical protein
MISCVQGEATRLAASTQRGKPPTTAGLAQTVDLFRCGQPGAAAIGVIDATDISLHVPQFSNLAQPIKLKDTYNAPWRYLATILTTTLPTRITLEPHSQPSLAHSSCLLLCDFSQV